MAPRDQRRLAAIVCADVVGYSRLIGFDESGTLAALRHHRAELIDPLVAEHGGRIVKTMGDGLLLEFPSVVNATLCAVEIQEGMAARNTGVPPDQRIAFRIGVNLGDVIFEEGDIFGDGVNVAARLQELAEAGGIAISRRVHEDVQDRLKVSFVAAGERTLKNIARPVQIWRWQVSEMPASDAVPIVQSDALPLSDKPAIAVLPFDNMSRDPDQEYFSEGLTEDIITELSRFREFAVIARNSSFAFKGQSVAIRSIASELGADYVVEGSVRKAGNRVRVTAQLIDASSGAHLWADRFDHELADVFALQDEVTVAIVTAIAPRSFGAEVHRTDTLSEAALGSWDLVLKARHLLARHDKVSTHQAQQLLEKAIDLDARNAQAYCWLGNAFMIGTMYGWYEDIDTARREAKSAAQRAVMLDPEDAVPHVILASTHAYLNDEIDIAIEEAGLALSLNQNLAFAHGTLSGLLSLKGDLQAAQAHLHAAFQLSPRDPDSSLWLVFYNVGAFTAGKDSEVVEKASQAIRTTPDYPAPYRQRAASLALLGHLEPARRDVGRLLELMPDVTVKKTREQLSFFPGLDRLLGGLRKAGLPES